RLLETKRVSQEGLGMTKSPQITAFHLPPSGLGTAFFLYSVVPYGAFGPLQGGSIFAAATQFMHSYISQKTFKMLFTVTVALHMLESVYTLYLCRKHKASLRVTTVYIIATLFIGLPVWKDIRKRMQDSVTKFE
ncbi:hypothetical protein C8R43DRAFT_893027, partial [Mycena crocata]